MTTQKKPPRLPMEIPFDRDSIRIRTFVRQDGDAMLAFAQSLPEEDLLFLDRDITSRQEIDRWIEQVEQGTVFAVAAWQNEKIIGYATYEVGSARWTQHVAELRVVVSDAVRGRGLGRILLELVFETALARGIRKVVARMTPEQLPAEGLFKQLGFEEEGLLHDHAMDANGQAHDLIVLSFRAEAEDAHQCQLCGVPILAALSLDGMQLCSHCYETRYQELGGGD